MTSGLVIQNRPVKKLQIDNGFCMELHATVSYPSAVSPTLIRVQKRLRQLHSRRLVGLWTATAMKVVQRHCISLMPKLPPIPPFFSLYLIQLCSNHSPVIICTTQSRYRSDFPPRRGREIFMSLIWRKPIPTTLAKCYYNLIPKVALLHTPEKAPQD